MQWRVDPSYGNYGHFPFKLPLVKYFFVERIYWREHIVKIFISQSYLKYLLPWSSKSFLYSNIAILILLEVSIFL